MILKNDESLGSALYSVALNIESMREQVADIAKKLDEFYRLVESLRSLSDMIGESFVDKLGDEELEKIYAKWESISS